MSDYKKGIKQYLCPACFAREIDVLVLHYDEEDKEYYCPKCCYAGKAKNVERFFKVFQEEKYKDMKKPHEDS